MTSRALQRWQTTGKAELDEIEAAHAAVGGTGRGRRYATLQVNHAYVMLLSSQFQRYCRDLHTEGVDFVASATLPITVRPAVRAALIQDRRLDKGNPAPGNLGVDFARFSIAFWDEVKRLDTRNASRRDRLEDLNTWRNAIAHQDWTRVGPALDVKVVRQWRSSCSALALSFDAVVGESLRRLVGQSPW